MAKEKLLLHSSLPPGDILTMTAAVRDLQKNYPGKYLVNVETPHPALWENSPYLNRGITRQNADRVIAMHYPIIQQCSTDRETHFINGYIRHLASELGLDIPLTELKPDVHFTRAERDNRPYDHPYWVLFAGGKDDYTAKWWHRDKFQAVIDHFAGQIQFVNVGQTGKGKYNPKMTNVIPAVGNTTFRDLMTLILHADGVVCPTTCGLHLAAACNKPCITIGGGREGPWWEQYPGQVFLHTVGSSLECCKDKPCWKTHVDLRYVPKVDKGKALPEKARQGRMCKIVVNDGVQLQPKCMDMIKADHVINAINKYRKNSDDNLLRCIPKVTLHDFVPYNDCTGPISRKAICVCLYGEDSPDGAKVIRNKLGEGIFESTPSMTFHDCHVRCLKSIIDNTPENSYKLYIGCNSVDTKTLKWIDDNISGKIDGVVLIHKENRYKYPVMGELFKTIDPDTKEVIWFDDDSYVTSDLWLHRVDAELGLYPEYDVFGEIYKIKAARGQWEWVKDAKWYNDIEPVDTYRRTGVERPVFRFPTGGFVVMRKYVIDTLGWPDHRIAHNGGDVMFGEACRQNRFLMKDLFRLGNIGIVISGATRRGFAEAPAGATNRNLIQKEVV